MSGTRLLSTQGNGAISAAATGSAAPAGTAPGESPGASPFDAILMLEEVAAAASDAGIDAGAVELGTDGTDTAADDQADDEDNLELDDPLAFLAGLMAVAPRPHAHAAAGVTGEGAASADGADALASLSGGDAGDTGNPLLAGGDASVANNKTDDAAAAARALAAQAALNSLGDSAAKDDKSAAPRALDFLASPQRAAATDHAPAGAQMTTHVRDPRWADEFGTRIALLVNQRESVAAISLTPVDLGPVDVNVTVRDSQATIHFGAAQAETRALIEASLPKLRELLAAQGFQLMDASVSQGFTRQSKPDAPSIPRPSSVDEVTPVAARSIAMNGLLDTYA